PGGVLRRTVPARPRALRARLDAQRRRVLRQQPAHRADHQLRRTPRRHRTAADPRPVRRPGVRGRLLLHRPAAARPRRDGAARGEPRGRRRVRREPAGAAVRAPARHRAVPERRRPEPRRLRGSGPGRRGPRTGREPRHRGRVRRPRRRRPRRRPPRAPHPRAGGGGRPAPGAHTMRERLATRGGLLTAVAVLVTALLVSVVVAVGLGPAVIGPAETARHLWAAVSGGTITADEVTTHQIIWQIRAPRVLLAALVGAGLSAVGVAAQALVRNALADPFVLGVSSGASVGAVA